MKFRVLVAVVFAFATAITPAGWAQSPVDGKWEAKVRTQVGERTMAMNFKGEGTKLTGTISDGPAGEAPIEDGTLEGDTISFKQTLDFGGSSVSFTYSGKVKGNEITFTREGLGGRLEFTAKRVRQ